jgi:exodeoxyribonuclease-5
LVEPNDGGDLAEEIRDSKPVYNPPALNLSPGQETAIEAIEKWYHGSNEQIFRMFGPAGTGKTTIARLVPVALGISKYAFGAFSGKAAQVLRSKGCNPAGTLHSMIYGAPINLAADKRRLEEILDRTLEIPEEKRVSNWLDEVNELKKAIRDLETRIRLHGKLDFPVNFESELADADLLIADEVSMVSDRMAFDILSTDVRVLVLGDPEQLPPVRGDGYFTREEPDIMLSEVHRQALDSPVLSLATRVRNGGRIEPFEYQHGKRIDYTEFDQILCWRRATRWGAVKHVRELLERPPGEPVPGDTIMNLQNNKDLGVFNGQVFTILSVSPGRENDEYLLRVEDGMTERDLFVYGYGFTQTGEKDGEEARVGWNGDTAFVTFSQALTVHKAQGSEWGNVLLVDESNAMWAMENKLRGFEMAQNMTRRWLYTGITRASESITLVRKR